MSDEAPTTETQHPRAPQPPASPLLALLIMALAVVAFLTGAVRTMASAPSSSNDFLIEKVALIAALLLFLFSLAAFVLPRIRRVGAYASVAAVGGLILFSMLAD